MKCIFACSVLLSVRTVYTVLVNHTMNCNYLIFLLTYFAVFICPSVVCMPSLVRTLLITVAVSLVAYGENLEGLAKLSLSTKVLYLISSQKRWVLIYSKCILMNYEHVRRWYRGFNNFNFFFIGEVWMFPDMTNLHSLFKFKRIFFIENSLPNPYTQPISFRHQPQV